MTTQPSAKRPRTDTIDSEISSGDPESIDMQRQGGSNSGFQGFRGAFHGNTKDNEHYSELRKEYVNVTTRTVTNKIMTWACDTNPAAPEILVPQSNNEDFIFSADETLLSQPINMYAPLFGDAKLYNLASDGTTVGWLKWRLLRIRFNVQFKHFLGSWVQDGYQNYLYHENFNLTDHMGPNYHNDNKQNVMNPNFTQASPMWVYRDMYNDFSSAEVTATSGNIFPVPAASGTGTEFNNHYWRSKKSISNQDLMLDLNHVHENFNFTREVASKGAYFISGTQIKNVFSPAHIFTGAPYYDPQNTPNISNIIADLEQVATTATAYTTPNREGFNLLVVPAEMTYITTQDNEGGKLRCQPGFKTMCIIKAEADWEGWDYNYGTTYPERALSASLHSRFFKINEMARKAQREWVETKRETTKISKLGIMGGPDPKIIDIQKEAKELSEHSLFK